MRCIVLLVAVAMLAGCNGGTVDRHALTNDSSSIDSINCEGWLVARAVARGRVTDTYARAHAEELQVQAANLADALSTRPTTAGLEQRVRAAGKDAGRLASRLQRLGERVSSRAAAVDLAERFKQAGHCS